MNKHFSSILCAVLLLNGCAMIPGYERPASPVAENYPGAGESNPGLAAEFAWKDVFADERLKQLIGLALTNNLDLRVAILNVEQSRAQYRITRAAALPDASGSGGYTRSRASDITSESWQASLGTAYEVDLFGRVRSLNKKALETYLATAEAQRGAQILLVAEVAAEYFALREAEEQLQLAQQTLAVVQESYELNVSTFAAGASDELDLRTAEGQVLTAKINVLTYERQRAQAENSLVLLIGEPLPADLAATRPFSDPDLVADIPAGLPSELILRRPDILAAEHRLKAANANIGAARAAFFPTIRLTATVGSTSSEFDTLFGSGTGVWSFSPQITLPIFTGGRNRADLKSAKTGKLIEVAHYQKAIQTAFREVADALVVTRSYAHQVEAEAARISAQKKRYELTELRYRQGEDSYVNILLAQQALYSAQQSLISAQYNKTASRIALYKALGGGWK